jgi:hypothetical protein
MIVVGAMIRWHCSTLGGGVGMGAASESDPIELCILTTTSKSFWPKSPLVAILAIFGAFCVLMYILENSTMSEFLAKLLLAAILAIFGAFCVLLHTQENSNISGFWPKSPLSPQAAKFGDFRSILRFISKCRRTLSTMSEFLVKITA